MQVATVNIRVPTDVAEALRARARSEQRTLGGTLRMLLGLAGGVEVARPTVNRKVASSNLAQPAKTEPDVDRGVVNHVRRQEGGKACRNCKHPEGNHRPFCMECKCGRFVG